MRRSVIAAIGALALVMAIAATAVALNGHDHNDDPRHPMWGTTSGSSWSGPGWAPPDPGESMGGMRGAWTDSEFDYLSEMVAHHREAVTAAQELERSERSAMRAFGAQIVTTQSAQIEQMTAWLAQWYPGRSPEVDYEPMMGDLSGLSGDRLDRAFLKDMIGHHMVAVMMSQQLLIHRLSDRDEVNALARSIRDEQHAEIFQMRRWLADWFDGGRGSGWGIGPGMMW